jgi:hypothetical protein
MYTLDSSQNRFYWLYLVNTVIKLLGEIFFYKLNANPSESTRS